LADGGEIGLRQTVPAVEAGVEVMWLCAICDGAAEQQDCKDRLFDFVHGNLDVAKVCFHKKRGYNKDM
jgi:hypothetical protein